MILLPPWRMEGLKHNSSSSFERSNGLLIPVRMSFSIASDPWKIPRDGSWSKGSGHVCDHSVSITIEQGWIYCSRSTNHDRTTAEDSE